jgi:diguanylate cyclase (GGDEF)-like protein/PAS domain S-box-containing protein
VNFDESALLPAIGGPSAPDGTEAMSAPSVSPIPTLIGYWDRDLRNVAANDAYREYFGIPLTDLQGRHLSEVFSRSDFALTRPHLEAALQGVERLFPPALPVRSGARRYTQESYIPDIVSGKVRGAYHYITDATGQVEAEQQRDEAMRLFHLAMSNAPIGKTVLDATGHVLLVNPALCDLLGYSAREMIGSDFRRYVHSGDLATGNSDLAALVDGTAKHVASERRYVRRDGTTLWLQRDAVLVSRGYNGQDVVVAQFHDISNRRHAEAELARMADTDLLTGLRNRNALASYMDRRTGKELDDSLGVIFIDIDGFKDINDAHGHATGDAVLVQVGQRLSALLTRTMTAYRLGGDEFVVLDPGRPTGEHTANFARHLRDALTGSYDTGATLTALSASVGWTWGQAQHAGDLLRTADAEMYRHKAKYRRRRTDFA